MGSVSHNSYFDAAETVEPDGIFEVLRRYNIDSSPEKVNICVGAYRDEDGKPWVLPSVRMAEKKVVGADHEYSPMMGHKAFRDASIELLFHGSKALAENRIAGVQSLSGTGALLLAGMALKKANAATKTIYITNPTWPNHELLFENLGFKVVGLPYYNPTTCSYDAENFLSGLRAAEPDSAVILHACAHNPTGCDPSRAQWREIADVIRTRGLFPVFDSAYLGFNSGSVDEDAWAIRYFVEELRMEAAVCLSFSKSMGLYGERAGAVMFVAATPELSLTVQSILDNAQRATISTPPLYGARLAEAVMKNPEINKQWAEDLVTMSGRISKMRGRLFGELCSLGTPGSWEHIVKQTGMFGYLGITPEMVEYLEKEHHVYMASTSRISIAGMNEHNVVHVAKALDDTVRKFA
ncbi:hypothetical protein N0V93_008528 [Gnomoniopsis smithogilvyi]|uniref:Aspartate aminotransferase n=1 Tax=Gnomoniopsis smithogilvyi TaxID=1191159 RepID=A0A9W8YQ70_9PEZI|nr:hypothetical protein N0V93_008528 [Gnomoniopsis smithogilvyi]